MAERRTIGQLLLGFGRITEEDVENALQHQKEHGGYFGEALLALGLVTQEELEWGLASQFDLPYVFPDVESIDPEAASLVTPEWALAHLTLPIMKTSEALTVVVDSPIKTDAVDELQHRTELKIELALASAGKIRELIRQVYARQAAQEDPDAYTPVSFAEVVGTALDQGAGRFGVSSRGSRVTGWFDDRGTVRRRVLAGKWRSEMEEVLSPSVQESVEGRTRHEWSGRMSRDGVATPVEVRYLASSGGEEFVFRPVRHDEEIQERFAKPSPGILSEVRLLARSGSARFIVSTEPAELAHELVPYLAHLLLDPAWRTVYLTDAENPALDDVFSLRLPEDQGEWPEFLKELRGFHFDGVCADLKAPASQWLDPVLDLASAAFVAWDPGVDRRKAQDAGVKWELSVERKEDGELTWRLEPLKV